MPRVGQIANLQDRYLLAWAITQDASPNFVFHGYALSVPRYSLPALLLLSACAAPDAPLEDGRLPGADPVLPNAAGCGVFDEDLRLSTQRQLEALDLKLSSESPDLDYAALKQFTLQYARAWTVHRAQHVVAGEIDGLGHACDRSSIFTHTQFAILRDFRGNATQDHVARPEQYQRACGQRRILATGPWTSPVPEAPLGCTSICVTVPNFATQVVAELRDTARSRAAVEDWIQASEPLWAAHLVEPGSQPEMARLGAYAPWSAVPSVLQGLALAQGLADVTVLTASSGPEGHRVTLEANLGFGAAPVRVALAFECGDSRLLQVGSRWLLPFVYDPYDLSGRGTGPTQALQTGGLFFIPGLVFEPEGPVFRILLELRHSMLNRD